MKKYIAVVTNKETGKRTVLKSMYVNKTSFAEDLRRNGYKVAFISTEETFEEDTRKYEEKKATAKRVRELKKESKERVDVLTELENTIKEVEEMTKEQATETTTTEQKEVNTMNTIEKALATTEKKTRERRHYFATKGKRGISIFCNEYRPDLYVFNTWIARKKWIEEQETSVDIAVMERTATECKQAYSHIVDGVREWDEDVYFM